MFHPKVIWWGGYGAYIGSANLTDSGWLRNIECGLFISDPELIQHGLDLELERFFEQLEQLILLVRKPLMIWRMPKHFGGILGSRRYGYSQSLIRGEVFPRTIH